MKTISKFIQEIVHMVLFFAERINRSKRDLLKEMVFEKSNAKWIDVLPTKTK